MDLRSELLKNYSIQTNRKIIEWIECDQDKIQLLVDLFLYGNYRIAQRSSWIVSEIAEKSPLLIEPYLPLIVNRMIDPTVHIAVKRNALRLLQFVSLPEDLKGFILDTCFQFLEDPKEANGVQVFAMSVIANFSEEFPELIPELKLIIERNLENGASPAFKSRANKILNTFSKPKIL